MEKKQDKEFRSFFMGGYECADHINRSGKRVNLLKETEHDARTRDDYRLLTALGMKVAREGICWSEVEIAPFVFDFSEVKSRIDAAAEEGVQIIWDLCHFGYPDGMIPTHPQFPERFMSLCRAFALFHKKATSDPLYVVPINEISFLSWHSGDVRGTVPFAINSGFDIKYHLCKAAIEGIKVLRQTDPDCKILLVEPLVKIHAANDKITPEELDELNSHQFQAMDMIAGRKSPELGGSPYLFDLLGFNYYHNNQWDHLDQTLHWPPSERQLTPLSELLQMAHSRYSCPIILSETGHFGSGRCQWIEEVVVECRKAITEGVDLRGICVYPVIDRPDWDNLMKYNDCGIWDLDQNKNRIANEAYVSSVKKCIGMMDPEQEMLVTDPKKFKAEERVKKELISEVTNKIGT